MLKSVNSLVDFQSRTQKGMHYQRDKYESDQEQKRNAFRITAPSLDDKWDWKRRFQRLDNCWGGKKGEAPTERSLWTGLHDHGIHSQRLESNEEVWNELSRLRNSNKFLFTILWLHSASPFSRDKQLQLHSTLQPLATLPKVRYSNPKRKMNLGKYNLYTSILEF